MTICDILKWETALTRIFHEWSTATADMGILPGVLGSSYDRLRTNSPCDVLFKHASDAKPCECPARGASACAARGKPIFTVS
jgi:hypothetical protein